HPRASRAPRLLYFRLPDARLLRLLPQPWRHGPQRPLPLADLLARRLKLLVSLPAGLFADGCSLLLDVVQPFLQPVAQDLRVALGAVHPALGLSRLLPRPVDLV